VLHAARWKYRTQKSRQKWPSGHHPTTLSGYIFATKAHIDYRKKLVKQQYVLHMSPQYGDLRPASGWDRLTSLGTPANFNGFCVLAALLYAVQHLVAGVSQTLRHWTEGATYVRQGDHHVGHWPTFIVVSVIKTGRTCYPIKWDAVWDVDWGGRKEAHIRWGQILTREGTTLRVKRCQLTTCRDMSISLYTQVTQQGAEPL